MARLAVAEVAVQINWTTIIVAGFAAIPATLAAIAAIRARQETRETRHDVKELEIKVDGRLSQLLERTAASSQAVGELKGRDDERANTQPMTSETEE